MPDLKASMTSSRVKVSFSREIISAARPNRTKALFVGEIDSTVMGVSAIELGFQIEIGCLGCVDFCFANSEGGPGIHQVVALL